MQNREDQYGFVSRADTQEQMELGNSQEQDNVFRLDIDNISDIANREYYYVEYEGELQYFDSLDWRKSRRLQSQILLGFAVLILFGLADLTVGTLIPKLQEYYSVNDTQTSLFWLTTTSGYFLMAMMSQKMHSILGLRGVLVFGNMCMLFTYMVASMKPPYPLFVACYLFNGLGFGSLDSCLNTWMGNLKDSNQILGILHGCYGIGCMISPPLISNLLERKKNPWKWNDYYLILASIGSLLVILAIFLFKNETPKKYKVAQLIKNKREKSTRDNAYNTVGPENESLGGKSSPTPNEVEIDDEDSQTASFLETVRSRSVWLFAFILFLYVGGETAFGSWLVTYLLRSKHATYISSAYMDTCFWTGLTTGRFVFGFYTAHYFKDEITANSVYILISLAGYVGFWLFSWVPYVIVLYVFVFIAGLFSGPIFPTTIVSSVNILPNKFHTSGIGFICAFGGGGGAAIPFLVGILSQTTKNGISLLPFLASSCFGLLYILWVIIIKLSKH